MAQHLPNSDANHSLQATTESFTLKRYLEEDAEDLQIIEEARKRLRARREERPTLLVNGNDAEEDEYGSSLKSHITQHVLTVGFEIGMLETEETVDDAKPVVQADSEGNKRRELVNGNLKVLNPGLLHPEYLGGLIANHK